MRPIFLLDEVEEAHAAADVLLRDADHQAEVRLGQAAPAIGALLDQPAGAPLQRHLGGIDGS